MFLTLTCRVRQGDLPDVLAKKLSHAWRILRLRIMRGKPERDAYEASKQAATARAEPAPPVPHSWPFKKPTAIKPLPFITVIERTELGWPHLHILLRCRYIPWAWLSSQMEELLESPVVRVERIRNKSRIVGYVSKYIGKDPHKFKTCKRYWQSQDFDLRPAREKPDRPKVFDREMLFNISLAAWADRELCSGRRIEAAGKYGLRSRAPPKVPPDFSAKNQGASPCL